MCSTAVQLGAGIRWRDPGLSERPHHTALTLEGRGLGINVVLPGSKVDKLGSSENQTLLHPEIYG